MPISPTVKNTHMSNIAETRTRRNRRGNSQQVVESNANDSKLTIVGTLNQFLIDLDAIPDTVVRAAKETGNPVIRYRIAGSDAMHAIVLSKNTALEMPVGYVLQKDDLLDFNVGKRPMVNMSTGEIEDGYIVVSGATSGYEDGSHLLTR